MRRFAALHLTSAALTLLAMGLAGAGIMATATSFDIYTRPGQLVEVEPGRELNVRCSGKGEVTILLESGLGYPSYSWRNVQPKLANFARVCSYDRAGLGFSDAGPMPRTSVAMADDIARLVKTGVLKPPFVLVGGSLGGQVVRQYAFRHPEHVLGLVLVDPYAEGQYRAFAMIEPSITQELIDVAAEELRCVQALRAGMSSADAERQGCVDAPYSEFSDKLKTAIRQQRMSPRSYEAVYSESLMLDSENEKSIARDRIDLSPKPIIILSATNEFNSKRLAPVRADLLAEKARLHRSIADLSTAGEVRFIDSAHVIQTDEPESVVLAVRDVLISRSHEEK